MLKLGGYNREVCVDLELMANRDLRETEAFDNDNCEPATGF